MFLDSEDYEHLVKQLNNDIPLLIKKIAEMKSIINKELKKREYYESQMRPKQWRNHQTNVKWTIYFNVAKDSGKTHIGFIPITSFNDKDGTKSYFVFCFESINLYSAEHHLFKIFRGHFINRYLVRTESKIVKEDVDSDIKAHSVILNFIISQDLTINYNYRQNEKWFMFLNPKGVAMVRKDRLYMLFDTFLPLSKLKPDQNDSIRQYLDDLLLNNPVDFIINFQIVSLKPDKGWDKFFSQEKIDIAFKSAYKKNPELTLQVLENIKLFSTL
jgi:hypothetical protein